MISHSFLEDLARIFSSKNDILRQAIEMGKINLGGHFVQLKNNISTSISIQQNESIILRAQSKFKLSRILGPITDVVALEKILNPFMKQFNEVQVEGKRKIQQTSSMIFKKRLHQIKEEYWRLSILIQNKGHTILLRYPSTQLPIEYTKPPTQAYLNYGFVVLKEVNGMIIIDSLCSYANTKIQCLQHFLVERLLCLEFIAEVLYRRRKLEQATLYQGVVIESQSVQEQALSQCTPFSTPNKQKSLEAKEDISLETNIRTSHVPYQFFEIESTDEQNKVTKIDVRDYYVCNFNDTNDFLDRRFDPDHPAFKNEKILDRVNDLDDWEKEVFREFKQKYREYHFSDNLLIRFLTARGFDISDASNLLDWQIQWRKENRINWLEEKQYDECIKYRVFNLIGYDKLGRNVAYAQMKNLKPKEVDHQRFKMSFVAFIEKVCRCSLGFADSYLTLVDVEGFGWQNFNIDLVKELLRTVATYYPERQYKVYVLNSSLLTRSIFRIIKPFLPQRTLDKLIFCGCDPQQIKEALLNDVPLEFIPTKFGGLNRYNL